MAEPKLSLVIATVSRPTLARTLRSLVGQAWRPGDEVLLVGDGPQPVGAELFPQFGLPGRYVQNPGPVGRWGHLARNWVLDTGAATGTHLMALDDDDEYTPDAIATVRAALAAAPDRPHIFRMSGHPSVGTVWKEPKLVVGNLSTACLVMPNDPARLGRYGMRYSGDCDFAATTVSQYPDGPVWREEVICRVRPTRGS